MHGMKAVQSVPSGRQILAFFEVLYNPRRAFQGLQGEPTWWLPYVLNGAIAVALGIIQIPFAEQLARMALPPGAPVEALDGFRQAQVMAALVPLVALPIRWLLFSGVLFAVVISMDWDWPEFRAVFALVAFSHTVLTLRDIVNAAGLSLRGVYAIRSMADMDTVPGLGWILDGMHVQPTMVAALNAIDLFTVWHIAAVGVGVSVLTNRSLQQTIWAPTLVWLIVVLLNACLVLLL
jgi:hypothetical protein